MNTWNDGNVQIHRSEIDAYQKRIAELEAEVKQVEGLFMETEGVTVSGRLLPTKEKVIEYCLELAASLDAAEDEIAQHDLWCKTLDERDRTVRQKVLADVKHWLLTSTNIAGASILLFSREFGVEE